MPVRRIGDERKGQVRSRMQNDDVNLALAKLATMPQPPLPDGFMDGVWMRAGKMEELSVRRTRLAVFAVMAFVGLGAGFGATQAPAYAGPASYQLVDGADLSPASLLHVEP